jgi:hypothetical protein
MVDAAELMAEYVRRTHGCRRAGTQGVMQAGAAHIAAGVWRDLYVSFANAPETFTCSADWQAATCAWAAALVLVPIAASFARGSSRWVLPFVILQALAVWLHKWADDCNGGCDGSVPMHFARTHPEVCAGLDDLDACGERMLVAANKPVYGSTHAIRVWTAVVVLIPALELAYHLFCPAPGPPPAPPASGTARRPAEPAQASAPRWHPPAPRQLTGRTAQVNWGWTFNDSHVEQHNHIHDGAHRRRSKNGPVSAIDHELA